MSLKLNPAIQYGAACVLLGGLCGAKNSRVHRQVWPHARQGSSKERHRTPSRAGCGDSDICALVRPPLAVARHGMKRVLSAVLRTWSL